MNMHASSPPRVNPKPRSAATIQFYTQCRNWHGYISAFAFLVLMFFSATGILLNHPDWLVGDVEPQDFTAIIASDALAAAQTNEDPGAALGALAAAQMPLLGVYSSGDVDSRETFLRFEGVKGVSTVVIDMQSGAVQASTQKTDAVTILNELHRGKNSGEAWKAIIDISGVLILILSLIGYILFFAMRFKLRTSLILTGASIAVLVGVFVSFVP